MFRCKINTLLSRSSQSFQPKIGSLIALKSTVGERHHYMFGYVEKIYRDNRKYRAPKDLTDAIKDGDTFLQLTILTSRDIYEKFPAQKFISLCHISFVRNNVSCYEALCHLNKSKLCDSILYPTPDVFQSDGEHKTYLVEEMPMNESQIDAITKVSEKCVINPNKPKVSVIHGPPGTGKTRTIVSLICQIVRLSKHMGEKCRILVCAPSNAAVDETTRRLSRLHDINVNLKIVRVGVKDSIHPDVRPQMLDTIVNSNLQNDLQFPLNESTKKELERKRKLINEQVVMLEDARKHSAPIDDIKSMERRLAELVRGKSELEKSCVQNPTHHERTKLYDKWQQRVLINAEVITSTLGYCTSNLMNQVFSKEQRPFTCCIIDEAGQCKESETWLPLMMGINKYVLVGDHKQLPACALSQTAQDKKFYQSLFERYFYYFVIEQNRRDIIHTLTVQYRMHPEIASWPSKHFYDNLLLTDKNIVASRTYGLKPYVVFNIQDSQEHEVRAGEICNDNEAKLVLTIVQSLEKCIIGLSVGVITPYQYQRHRIEQLLRPFYKKMKITVNTIDAFQGQEKDIVILSFVRANSSASIGFLSQRQRLNVALTRARKSCFVIGHLPSLSSNEDWRSLIEDGKSRNVIVDLYKRDIENGNLVYEKFKIS